MPGCCHVYNDFWTAALFCAMMVGFLYLGWKIGRT